MQYYCIYRIGRAETPLSYRKGTLILYQASNGEVIPIGTAVVIACASNTILLTAGHCAMGDNGNIYAHLRCCQRMRKLSTGGYSVDGVSFDVEVLCARLRPDIAVLHRITGQFAPDVRFHCVR